MTKVIVPSCQKYSDAWGPFQDLKAHFWPDCPYETVLISDTDNQDQWKGRKILRGQDVSWADNFVYGLEFGLGNDDEPIIMVQEDFFLSAPVKQEVVTRAVDFIMDKDLGLGCVRLMPCPGPDDPYDSVFGIIKPEAAYRVSCQAAVWDRRTLLSILSRVDSPWNFETQGTQMHPPGTFLSVYRELPFPFSYINSAINRGKWNPDAIKLCQGLGIQIDPSRRPIENVQG